MSESFTPTHAPPPPSASHQNTTSGKKEIFLRCSHKAPLMTSCTYTLASSYGEEDLLASS